MVEIIASGKLWDIVYLALLWIGTTYYIRLAQQGKWRKIRTIPAVQAIEEMVGRGTEMGRPVHFCPGDSTTLVGSKAPMILAGLAICKHVAELAAKYDAEMFATVASKDGPYLLVMIEDIMRQAYLEAGKPEKFRPGETVRFVSDQQHGLTSAMAGIYQREQVAATVLVGGWAGATVNMIGSAHAAGAMVLYGTCRQAQLMWAIALADYVLITEEIFAAAAQLSEEPIQLGSIAAQDIAKWVAVAIGGLGFILAAAGMNVGFLNW
jgi:hypothetical protein